MVPNSSRPEFGRGKGSEPVGPAEINSAATDMFKTIKMTAHHVPLPTGSRRLVCLLSFYLFYVRTQV